VSQALLGVVAEEGEEPAEQQRPRHVHREGRPGPLAGIDRDRLRQPDPEQRPDHAAEVDRQQLAGVVRQRSHRWFLSAALDEGDGGGRAR